MISMRRIVVVTILLLLALGIAVTIYWKKGNNPSIQNITSTKTSFTTTGWMMSMWRLGEINPPESFPSSKPSAHIHAKTNFSRQYLPLHREDLLNPEVLDHLNLNSNQLNYLLNKGFILAKWGKYNDFSRAYSELKQFPIYVTVDSFLHAYHVQFDSLLADIEEKYLYNDLYNLTKRMIEHSSNDILKAGEPAERNLAYFSVAMKLLDPNFKPSDEVEDIVNAELKRINDKVIAKSPLFGYKEDYSQYRPRGHYTRSEKLQRYFKAMMWYGRMAFLLREGLVNETWSRELTTQAALISADLSSDKNASDYWEKIYTVTSFFVGFADDYTPYDYLEALKSLFDGSMSLKNLYSLKESDSVINELRAELIKRGKPKIYGGTGICEVGPPITKKKLDECLEKSAGMRFMGQRYVPDSYAFQRLVAPSVGLYTGSDEKRPFTLVDTPLSPARGFPRGLDWFATMGSNRALEILRSEGDTSYQRYDEVMSELRKEFSNADWSKNLYWSWLDVLRHLVMERNESEGYPAYMRSVDWVDRQLQAALASWAELRHDTILYAKQSYTPKLTAMPPSAKMGAVEPLPDVYIRLESLVNQTKNGLKEMGYLSEEEEARLDNLIHALKRAEEISIKELEGKPLNKSDLYFIGNFNDVLDSIMLGLDKRSKSTVLVADVHTDLNSGQVLEEAVGRIDMIVVVFPTPNGTALMVGPVLTYYEFKHPLKDRLTDEKWSDMLKVEEPKMFPWQKKLYGKS